MTRILLVESHFRTRTWFKALVEYEKLYVISVLKGERKRFLQNGVSPDRILDLSDFSPEELTVEGYCKIRHFEKKYALNVNSIVSTDRTLRRCDAAIINSYALYLLQKIERFMKEVKPDIIFIEPTWTHEQFIVKIANNLGIEIFAPTRDKLLENRTFFFEGADRHTYFKRVIERDPEIGRRTLSVVEQTKPQYFDFFTKRNKFQIRKILVLLHVMYLKIRGYHNTYIHAPFFSLLTNKIKDVVRAFIYARTLKFYDIMSESRGIILLTLHVQPEAGIDVIGARYSNQYEFIRQICRTVPAGYILAVKEHPHDFGRRRKEFYRSLDALPNVVLLSPYIESRVLIRLADLVISTAGTSSLEAALLGVPAVTAVKMYFHSMMVRESFDPFQESIGDLIAEIEKWKCRYNSGEINKIIEDIQKNTFQGNFLDFTTDSRIMEESNIELLSRAFQEVINERLKSADS